MSSLKSPQSIHQRISPNPSYYNQYSTQVPVKEKKGNNMSLKNIFNPKSDKKLNVGPTQSIYNTIK